MKILIATKNPAKAREIKLFLGSANRRIEFVSFPNLPDVEETGSTFEENAVLKARAYFEWFGVPSIADDGGLEIDFLGGEPGVKSRRWSFDSAQDKPGREKTDQELINIALEKLKGAPREKRTARLRTVGAYIDGINVFTETGSVEGYIVEEQTVECEPGYPFRAIFWIPKFSKLYQDLTREEHEQVNHRKEVYQKLAERIRGLK